MFINLQCLGSGSVRSGRFLLPGSRSAKICRSTDPDPNDKISTKKKIYFQPKSQLLKKERL